jgi:hypothetical protein
MTSDDFKALFTDLIQLIDAGKIYVGGYQLVKHKLDVPENVIVVQSIDDITVNVNS